MTPKKKRTLIILATLAVVLLSLIIWVIWSNVTLKLSTYTVSSENLPKSFDGYRIAHISDLHNAEFGSENEKLLKLLRESAPDIIVFTGDIIDSRHTDIEVTLNFAEEAAKIAPCYYVTGNHEAALAYDVYQKLENGLIDIGVNVLHGAEAVIEKDGESISIIGIDDPLVAEHPQDISGISSFEGFKVLLTHRPEYFDNYASFGVDLVLSGHTHGGQIRIPFIGSLFAPGQGLFPEYDAGMFTKNGTDMIISQGIGNSSVPVRFNCRPELVLVELECAE